MDSIPDGKWQRTFSSGKTAAKIGGKVLNYLSKKPFLSAKGKKKARAELDRKSAKILFDGLSMLKGTALKAAQMLSMELDIFPEQVRKELEKSYHQVPPMNRALIRKIVSNYYQNPPEKIFKSFDDQAFAAASLGQVHKAISRDNTEFAIKVQYPGIKNTIGHDMAIARIVLKPMPEYKLILQAMAEIEEVLLLETDYILEAENQQFFQDNLNMEKVYIPSVYKEYSTEKILCQEFLNGPTLDQWLKTNPDQAAIDRIAQILHDIFLYSFYELHCIHADPNPGNFIIMDNSVAGLLDFGCIKYFDTDFVELYRQFVSVSMSCKRGEYADLLIKLNLLSKDLKPGIFEELVDCFVMIGKWFGSLYHEEFFDFKQNPQFFIEGRKILYSLQKHRKHFESINSNFIFLDRTRYGLLRLFEKMGARIRVQNRYENPRGAQL